MASGIFAILDDIAALMDDVAVATKVATKKTAAILGDDLAVNAEKATGFLSSRELPVLWAITKGSFINKVIIIPIALLLNAYFPKVIIGILIIGGCYLAYEGVEKIVEFLFHRNKKGAEVIEESKLNAADQEKSKIKSAITTDFILSIEIVILALAAVNDKETSVQIMAVSAVAILATVGVYGLVALIVRMDDLGYRLINSDNDGKGLQITTGKALVKGLPIIIKSLSVIGTIALILVSGGIFAHNIPFLHHTLEGLPSIVRESIFGIVGGIIILLLITIIKKIFFKPKNV